MRAAEKPKPSGPQTHEVASIPLSRSTKIRDTHLAKLAIVYVRQSSPQQVLENRESTRRQYALVDAAVALGWPRARVLVIDEDQGQSGRSAAGRLGFQRLLAELTLDHVGLILGLEMSRLARSDKDWHHLLELCGVFDTLLADQDGVYDAADPNDRLLLGLKGAMSSLELQTMRNRLEKGRRAKAQRGELFCCVPLGYVRLPGGKVGLDPDAQARAVVGLLFDKFEELGSARALFYWLVDHDIRLPVRPRGGPKAGALEWRRPRPSTLAQVLHHPMYAGAYAHGRRPVDSKRPYARGKRRTQRWVPLDQWQVLIRDHLPAYISGERYLRNLERLKQNQTSPNTRGTPRQGCALLCGLLFCGRCGWRMQVGYRVRDKPHYRCLRHVAEANEPCGCVVSANGLDERVSQQVLRALEPAALALSLRAQADVRQERDRLDRHWRQTLQRAQYEAAAAERRYRAVDAENRLVAATLERQWEDALRQQRAAQEEYDRFCRQTLPKRSAAEEARIASLASDIPALWRSTTTTNAGRQAILRCLVERVVVYGEYDSERVEATIHWAGGHTSRVEFARPVRTYGQLSNRDRLMKRLADLREAGKTAAQTADILNAEGFAPINPSDTFNLHVVRDLLLKLGLRGERYDDALLAPGEWWIRDLAKELKMSWERLREWALKGWLHGRQTKVEKLWILWADREEVKRLRKLRSGRSRGVLGYPEELTTPKQRPAEK